MIARYASSLTLGVGVTFALPVAPPPPVAREPGWLALTDGPLLPIATVAPSYPAGARNLEVMSSSSTP